MTGELRPAAGSRRQVVHLTGLTAYGGLRRSAAVRVLWLGLLLGLPHGAGAAEPLVRVLDVPFVSQSEDLCGGAAAAMVLRFWGVRGVDAESFAHLVDRRAGGIRTTDLLQELNGRGWAAAAVPGSEARLADEVTRNGRPVLALIEDRPGTYHYVVVVGAPERGFIFHDPARTSYRVLPRDEFLARWRTASMWMALVAPSPPSAADAARATAGDPAPRLSADASRCEALVADGVRLAQAGDQGGAERALTSALSCPGSAAYRELAGLRVLQKRWSDVAALAGTASEVEPSDADAWRLLATARFLQDDRSGALVAFNRAGEPALDTVQIAGLRRTRNQVLERQLGVEPGEQLTKPLLDRARRRLDEVPSLRTGTLDYAPVGGGRAEMRTVVDERGLLPTGVNELGTLAGRALFTRDARASIASMTGGGERLDLQYRFHPGRPRVAAVFRAPAPWGGVWSVAASWERQPFDSIVPTAERTSGRVEWSQWLTGRLRVSLRGGTDRWQDIGARAAVGATAYGATLDDRVTARLDVDAWMGETRFGMAKTIATLRSSNERRGLVFVGSAGAGAAADGVPVESWFAGDTGNARPGPVLLRGHGLVHDGQFFRLAQMGRTIVHGSAEGQYWFSRLRQATPAGATHGPADATPQRLSVGVAAFVDTARVSRRALPGDKGDVDVGAGLRLGLPGGRGSVRLDAARGLAGADTKFSFGYDLR